MLIAILKKIKTTLAVLINSVQLLGGASILCRYYIKKTMCAVVSSFRYVNIYLNIYALICMPVCMIQRGNADMDMCNCRPDEC